MNTRSLIILLSFLSNLVIANEANWSKFHINCSIEMFQPEIKLWKTYNGFLSYIISPNDSENIMMLQGIVWKPNYFYVDEISFNIWHYEVNLIDKLAAHKHGILSFNIKNKNGIHEMVLKSPFQQKPNFTRLEIIRDTLSLELLRFYTIQGKDSWTIKISNVADLDAWMVTDPHENEANDDYINTRLDYLKITYQFGKSLGYIQFVLFYMAEQCFMFVYHQRLYTANINFSRKIDGSILDCWTIMGSSNLIISIFLHIFKNLNTITILLSPNIIQASLFLIMEFTRINLVAKQWTTFSQQKKFSLLAFYVFGILYSVFQEYAYAYSYLPLFAGLYFLLFELVRVIIQKKIDICKCYYIASIGIPLVINILVNSTVFSDTTYVKNYQLGIIVSVVYAILLQAIFIIVKANFEIKYSKFRPKTISIFDYLGKDGNDTKKMTNGSDNGKYESVCPICLIMFSNGYGDYVSIDDKNDKKMCITPCGHVFHKSCLNMWIKDNYFCPNCRAEVRFGEKKFGNFI